MWYLTHVLGLSLLLLHPYVSEYVFILTNGASRVCHWLTTLTRPALCLCPRLCLEFIVSLLGITNHSQIPCWYDVLLPCLCAADFVSGQRLKKIYIYKECTRVSRKPGHTGYCINFSQYNHLPSVCTSHASNEWGHSLSCRMKTFRSFPIHPDSATLPSLAGAFY